MVPATLLIIFVLLYVRFGRFDEALLVMATLPFALTGGISYFSPVAQLNSTTDSSTPTRPAASSFL